MEIIRADLEQDRRGVDRGLPILAVLSQHMLHVGYHLG